MFTSSLLWLLASLFCLVAPSFSLVTTGRGQEQGDLNVSVPKCSSSAPYDSACWNKLSVGDYVKKWWTVNQGICQQRDLLFVPCFMNQAFGGSEIIDHCDKIGEALAGSEGQKACPLFAADTKGKLHVKALEAYSKTPQDAYILYHIAAQWSWFQSISDALTATKFANGIEPLLRLFGNFSNPRRSVQYNSLLSSITAGVLDLKLPSGAGNFSSILKRSPGNIRVFSTRYTPAGLTGQGISGIDDSLWLDGTKGSVEELAPRYISQLNDALGNITNSLTLFNDFSADGAFIADADSLVATTDFLLQKFYTWLTSYILNTKLINISVARDTDPYTFHKYGHDSAARVDCDYYEAGGICSAWWHDNSTNATYGLDSTEAGTSSHNYYAAMKQLFANYTTGELLFAGADACNRTGKKHDIILNDTTGTVDCISATNVISFNDTCADVDCEFSTGASVSQSDWGAHKCFPPSYLGSLRSTHGDFRPCTNKLLGNEGS
ncbi:MAG: hypothetical protein M1835_006841 [Candelina submexicana]|nr:MAG: hypothetical protein M1835_006841 [Candelina submexicana]